jgi:hypothetical protein
MTFANINITMGIAVITCILDPKNNNAAMNIKTILGKTLSLTFSTSL